MSERLVECIPNYSEACRPQVVEEIIKSVQSVPGVVLLDRHSDMDHNRSVLTFVGAPEAVEEAAFRSIARAAELINLDEHRGAHPRIGATDVVPFVPISGVTMHECVDIAHRLGKRVGEELGIPVYLYEEAAAVPERQNLENIRKGQYEALKDEIGVIPERKPDYGPLRLGTAGATVIGARQFLIAFNVYLTTGDVKIAEKIAKTIRHSSGGLRYLKALGLLVEGRAQVSMNLTNFRKTALAQVVEMIRREAARYGAAIHHSELVGLIPQDALVDAAVWYLQLDQFEPAQVLERRLDEVRRAELASLKTTRSPDFLEDLAAGAPTPGGGSAAAYSGAAGAALTSMVARLTLGRKNYAAVQDEIEAILSRSESLRTELTAAIALDSEAYQGVIASFKMPKETAELQEARALAIEAATLEAIRVPLRVAKMAVEVMELAGRAIALGNVNAISDGATGAALARAALTGAGYNVRINAASLRNKDGARQELEQLSALEAKAAEIEAQIHQDLIARGGWSRA